MTKPVWLRTAESQIGIAEVPGPKSNPKILEWVGKVGKWLGIDYDNDDTPWCGLLVAMCLQSANYNPPKVAIRAKSWALWGEALDEPCVGAIMVFSRPGGHHVAFYESENSTAYRVLGGNQGNKVSYTWIAKARCIAIRWPVGYPKGERKIVGAAGRLSQNEA